MHPQKKVTTSVIGKIILLLFGLGITFWGIRLFIAVKEKHDSIDSVADARVVKILHLGKNSMGKNLYAITYKILVENPFEVLVTPSTLELEMGTRATYYYERLNPKDNHYIVHRWNFDPRLKTPAMLAIIGLVICIGAIFNLF